MCLLGLKELQKSWDVNNWVLQLFFQYLDESIRSRLLDAEERHAADAAAVTAAAHALVQHAEWRPSIPPSPAATPAEQQPQQQQQQQQQQHPGIDAGGAAGDFGMFGGARLGAEGMYSFYPVAADVFNLNGYREDFDGWLNAATAGNGMAVEGLDANGVDFLSRCL